MAETFEDSLFAKASNSSKTSETLEGAGTVMGVTGKAFVPNV